jgi:hypothetical protein
MASAPASGLASAQILACIKRVDRATALAQMRKVRDS